MAVRVGFVRSQLSDECMDAVRAASGNSIGSSDGPQARFASWRSPRAGQVPTDGNAARPETRVFADHRNLVSFLRDEFSKSCGRD